MSLLRPRVPRDLRAAAGNLNDKVRRRRIADLRRTPRTLIKVTAHASLYRYDPVPGVEQHGEPVLFVPPLAAPALAFDLRRGNSVVEYFVNEGRPVYLVDYGPVNFGHKDLGIEHWVDTVIPKAVQHVLEDPPVRPGPGTPPGWEGGRAGARHQASWGGVHLAGWSLGGIFTILTTAAHPELPILSATAVASPFDLRQVPLLALARPVNAVAGPLVGAAYRSIGGVPATLTRLGFQISALDKYLTKPIAVLANADDRDFLAQLEAVDRFMDNMYAYPGRTFGQLYHVIMRSNEFAGGTMFLAGRDVKLADIDKSVLVVAGTDDTLAPQPAVEHLLELVPNAPDTQLVQAPGGHLGVLTGRAAKRTTWPAMELFYARHDA